MIIMSILCRDVLNSLSHHYGLFSATDFVLSGSSAGGFGKDLIIMKMMVVMMIVIMMIMMMKLVIVMMLVIVMR